MKFFWWLLPLELFIRFKWHWNIIDLLVFHAHVIAMDLRIFRMIPGETKHSKQLAKVFVVFCNWMSIDRNGKWINPLFRTIFHYLITMGNTLSCILWILFIHFTQNAENPFLYVNFLKILQNFLSLNTWNFISIVSKMYYYKWRAHMWKILEAK